MSKEVEFYDYNRIKSYNALFNFILSPRGNGKTYGAKRFVIKRFLKYGEQFIYVRRYKTEFKKLKLFFDDIRQEFPNVKMEVKGKTFFINEKVCGYAIALSTSQTEKSTAYPDVTSIIFDEFIIDKSYIKYLPNEVEVFLDLYETVARFRENVKAYFLANKVTLVNPYFKYFDCIPKRKNRFSSFKDGEIVVEQFTSESFIEMKKKTRFGRLISGTKYGDYAIDNKSLRDSNTFISKEKPKDLFFLFSVIYNNEELAFWISFKEGLCYVNKSVQKNSQARFTITKDDHNINLVMCEKLSNFNFFNEFLRYYRLGQIRISDIDTKITLYEIMNYLGIK